MTDASGHNSYVVKVGSDGHYAAKVAAGTYRVSGESPDYNAGAGQYPCIASRAVSVSSDGTTSADVYCSEK